MWCYLDDKQSYDKKGAITAANKRYAEDRINLRIYPCSDHWHLTKQLRGTKRKHGKAIIKKMRRERND